MKKKDEKRNPKTEKNFGKRNLEEKTEKNRWKNCKIISKKYWKNFGKRLEKISREKLKKKNRWKNCKIIYEKYWKNFGKRLEKFSEKNWKKIRVNVGIKNRKIIKFCFSVCQPFRTQFLGRMVPLHFRMGGWQLGSFKHPGDNQSCGQRALRRHAHFSWLWVSYHA